MITGVNDQRNMWLGSPYLSAGCAAHKALVRRDLGLMGDAGLQVRVVIDIDKLDVNGDGVVDTWVWTDGIYRTTWEEGVTVLPVFITASTPTTATQYTRIGKVIREFLIRYQEDGVFWATFGFTLNNGGVGQRPCRAYELWNEQNHNEYWNNTPEQYAYMWCIIGDLCHGHVHPTRPDRPNAAPVKRITGGLADATSSNGNTPAQWLNRVLYWIDHNSPQNKPHGYGFHAYGAPHYTAVQAIHNTSAFYNGVTTLKPLWVTEFGWKSTTLAPSAVLYNYQVLVNQYFAWGPGVVEAAFAYAYRNGGGSDPVHDGFGWNNTTGVTTDWDNTQAQNGAQSPAGDWFSSL